MPETGTQPLKYLLLLLSCCLALPGCLFSYNSTPKGYLFTWTKAPYSLDLVNTPSKYEKKVVAEADQLAPGQGQEETEPSGSIIRITEPLSGYGLYTEFDSNAIGDIAQEHGLQQVYYADIEVLDILGIWRQHKIHIYGR